MSKDYYNILGVEKSASEEEIKKAFRRKAHELHPDKKGGDEQKFKDINEAYGVLGNKENRAKYDQFGSAAFQNGGFNPGAGGFGGFGGFDFNQGGFSVNMDDMGDLGDILGGMFGFGGRGGRQKRGRDLEMEINLEFKEAVFGTEKEVNLYTNSACKTCEGSGADPSAEIKTCSTCNGSGKVQKTQQTMLGVINTVVTCHDCHGKGKKADKACADCNGSGMQKREKTLKVKIPAGMSNGEALKLTGEGDFPGTGGKAGDLYIRVRVKSDANFTRQDQNILTTAYIPFSIMSLGGKVDIETVDGPVVLKIPSGTESGAVFKLRGKGVPYLSGYGRGDHMVTIMPEVPKKLTRDQKKLLEDLQNEGL